MEYNIFCREYDIAIKIKGKEAELGFMMFNCGTSVTINKTYINKFTLFVEMLSYFLRNMSYTSQN